MSAEVLFQAEVALYKIVNQQERAISERVILSIGRTAPYVFVLEMLQMTNRDLLLTADIRNVISPRFRRSDLCLFFNVTNGDQSFLLMVVFQSGVDQNQFVNVFANSLFRTRNKREITGKDIPEIDEEIGAMELLDDAPEDENDEVFGSEAQEVRTSRNAGDGGKNALLCVGSRTGNTMVMRNYAEKSDLGLFTTDRDCTFRMALPKITDDEGRPIVAAGMLTNNGDHGVYVLDQKRRGYLYDLNLDRGLVTGHVHVLDQAKQEQPVSGLLHRMHNDSTSPVFVGFNERNTMVIDTRVEQSVVDRSDYKTLNGFTCGQTTKSGRLAMASKDGIIRLYAGPARTRATVNFSIDLKHDPIKAIDISPDEQWVLVTTSTCLSLIGTKAASTGSLAFDYPMKDDKKPPIRIDLSVEQRRRVADQNGGKLPPFSSGKFECKGGKVVAIVASCGNALVSWGFKAIESGKNPRASITYVTGEAIVDDHTFDDSPDVLFMAPNQVSVAERRPRRAWS